MLITKNVAVVDSCTFSGDSGEAGVPNGELSAYSPAGYFVHPQVTSRIISDPTVIGSDLQHTIILQGADVDLTFADPTLGISGGGFSAADLKSLHDEGLTHYRAVFSGTLGPNGGTTDASFELISRALLDKITTANPDALALPSNGFETTILASISIFGDMSSEKITSQPFQYAVTICSDCVVNVLGACPLPDGTVPRVGNGCNAFQDGVVDCCTTTAGTPATTTLTCPASVAPPPTTLQ